MSDANYRSRPRKVTRRWLTEDEIELALRRHAGVQARAAYALSRALGAGVSRAAIANPAKASPRLQEAIREAKEEILDMAEDVVFDNLRAGDLQAARFVLETQGRNRGWTRKAVVLHTVDPSQLSEEELDVALAELESLAGSMKLIDVTPQK